MTSGPAVTTPARNEAPIARADLYAVPTGGLLTVTAPGVLGNDEDADGDGLVTALSSGPSSGVATLSSDGALTYRPTEAFVGIDTFAYTVDDGHGATATATVTVNVTARSTLWYLGTEVVAGRVRTLDDVAGPTVAVEPDHDADGDPGLTVKHSDGSLTEADPRRSATWQYNPALGVRLVGPVRLQLWSTTEDFKTGKPVTYHVWVQDCRSNGTDCRVLLSKLNVVVDNWNGGTAGWVFREIPLGSLDTTLENGRRVSVRVMFGQTDVWIALSGSRPSRFLIG